MCAHHALEKEFHCKRKNQTTNNVLKNWHNDTNKKVAGMKQGSMHADGFKKTLDDFMPTFDCIKAWCRKLRSILFPPIEDGELDFGIPADPNTLYG